MISELCLPENRVWGLEFENQNCIGTPSWLSSTTQQGCEYRCDGTALVLPDGRFNTADQYQASAGPEDPGSWNRYAYVEGDPVNKFDPTGQFFLKPACGVGDDPCVGSVGISMGGNLLGGNDTYNNGGYAGLNPCATIIYGLYGGTVNCAAPAIPVFFAPSPSKPQQPPPPQCPLVGLVGNYTLTDAWPVDAEFAPAMAAAIDEALSIMNIEGITPQINSGYRGTATQAAIPVNNRYPVAAPGQSWHNVGLAVDLQLNPNSQVGQEIIGAMETAGLTWGGTFTSKDNVHFQLPSAVNHGGPRGIGRITSGAPTSAQVAACETEHP